MAKSKSLPMRSEINKIKIVEDINATVASSNTVIRMENIAIGIIYTGS